MLESTTIINPTPHQSPAPPSRGFESRRGHNACNTRSYSKINEKTVPQPCHAFSPVVSRMENTKKKMFTSLTHEIYDYLPAVVRHTQAMGWFIEYYVKDPATSTMVRRRNRITRLITRCRTLAEKKITAQQIADTINAKLRGGWSPLHQAEDSRLYTPLPQLREKFLAAKQAEGCRPSTLTQYASVTSLFLRWCSEYGFSTRRSGTFLRPDAVRYMDHCQAQRNRHRSYNNTLKVLRSFWQWAVEHCYAKENPFITIKPMRKETKIRILVPPEARAQVAAHYAATRPAMVTVCQLIYSSAIRPAEIRKIQLKHIHLEQHYITIPADNAKNHHERCASITPRLMELLAPVLAQTTNADLYLFGKNEQLAPGKEPVNKDYFQKSWERMRQATGLPKEMQLYSLRDTGLTDLIHAGLDPLTVRQHADHSSLAMTDIYTSHFDPTVNNAVYTAAPAF